jgi:hypothetical protein
MTLNEYIAGLHVHTTYSDGEFTHTLAAEAAVRAGLDCLCVSDHNVWVKGPEHYYKNKDRKVLLLVGEEVHDAARQPQKNHLLVFGAQTELAGQAAHPQALIDVARQNGALTFLAHPCETEAPLFNEPDISWVNWEVQGFTGLEIWNYMSEFKGLLTSRANTLRYARNPEIGIMGPPPPVLEKWDELTSGGRKVVAIGGADAHGTTYHLGGLKRVVFPYEFLFRQVTTHLLSEAPLTGVFETDRALVLEALAKGHCFVGYDAPASTKGFRFTANSEAGNLLMGDEIRNRGGVTMQIAVPTSPGLPHRTPSAAAAKGAGRQKNIHVSTHLIQNGRALAHWENQTNITYIVPPGEAGVFRVEVRLRYQGRLRGWIYSNPIYLRAQS